jgi:hypothetical protein
METGVEGEKRESGNDTRRREKPAPRFPASSAFFPIRAFMGRLNQKTLTQKNLRRCFSRKLLWVSGIELRNGQKMRRKIDVSKHWHYLRGFLKDDE